MSFAPLSTDLNGVCAVACGVGTDWACAGHLSWPIPQSSSVALTFVATDYVSLVGVPGASVSVCSPADVACAAPLASAQTDATGTAVLTVSNAHTPGGLGLDAYLQITDPSFVPTLFYWGFPLGTSRWTVRGELLTPAEQQSLLASIHVTLDPNRGQIDAQVVDCAFHPAPGVGVSIDVADSETKVIYGLPGNATATSTDQTGLVSFLDVPPGSVQLTATARSQGAPVSRISIQVRAGWITDVTMVPTP
jgi:hypothetical protein